MPALAARAPFGATYIDHRHARGKDRLDHLARGGQEPARRVEPDDHDRRPLGSRPLQRLRQLAGRNEADRALDVDDQRGTIRRLLAECIAEGQSQDAETQQRA